MASKEQFQSAVEQMKEIFTLVDACKHPNGVIDYDDGMVIFDCEDCGMHMFIHPEQAEIYEQLAKG